MTRGPSGREEWVGIAADALVGLFYGILVEILGGPGWAALMTTLIVFQVLHGRRT